IQTQNAGATGTATLWTSTPQPTIPIPTPVPSLEPTSPPTAVPTLGITCIMTVKADSLNLRSGPGTNYGKLATLLQGARAQLVGRLADSSWCYVNYQGTVGWVSANTDFTATQGNCNDVPVISPPPSPVPPTSPPGIGIVSGNWTVVVTLTEDTCGTAA